MVAAVQAPDGSIRGIHRTYLATNGIAKAPVSPAKMMLGDCTGGAVRLAAAGAQLAIGEGIETCLSFMQATGIASWAGLSTSGIKALGLPALPLAEHVYLIVDNDPPGECAAQIAARRLTCAGRRVTLARPMFGNDVNDALRHALEPVA